MGLIEDMELDLKGETSGGGTLGVYQDVYQNGQLICKGWRNTEERVNLYRSFLPPSEVAGKSVLDLGCNLGQMCQNFKSMGASSVTGVDKSPLFVKWARKLSSDCKFEQVDLSDSVESLQKIVGTDKVDILLCLAVWDYVDPDHMTSILKTFAGKYLIFEGHADGPSRIDKPEHYQGRILDSYKTILEQRLQIQHTLLGWVDNGRRPVYGCRV